MIFKGPFKPNLFYVSVSYSNLMCFNVYYSSFLASEFAKVDMETNGRYRLHKWKWNENMKTQMPFIVLMSKNSKMKFGTLT